MRKKIDDIEDFFKDAILPEGPIRLSQAETIVDLPRFVDSHLRYVRGNPGNKAYKPYYDRLEKLYHLLNN